MGRGPAFLLALALTIGVSAVTEKLGATNDDGKLKLNLRTQVETAPSSGRWHALWQPTAWDANQTAIVVCDMWNDHYCVSAAKRVAEMAPLMNRVLAAARKQGTLIIHCPSGCMDKYEGTPQRRLAQQAPRVASQVPLQTWCLLNPMREPALPVSDQDPCDDEKPRPAIRFFERQIDKLEIAAGDAITDSAEAYYLMKQRGITNVLVMGVHTNMCVLGRPFSIRQLVYQGFNVALVRDLTDAMYNPRQPPFVSHFTGNDMIFEHIERYWCPTVTSADIVGGAPFRFAQDRRPHVVFVMAEEGYRTEETLPRFAVEQLGKDFRLSYVYENWFDRNDLPGLEVLRDADVAVWSIRRRTLPKAQLNLFREYIASGKPLVALRTTSHAFCLANGATPSSGETWPKFDAEVLGGVYQGDSGKGSEVVVRIASDAKQHPILTGLETQEFRVFSTLYRNHPLAATVQPLLVGHADKHQEPVAWTNHSPSNGRVFYTSLGHPDDFSLPEFRRLLVGSSRVDLQACKLEYSIVSPK